MERIFERNAFTSSLSTIFSLVSIGSESKALTLMGSLRISLVIISTPFLSFLIGFFTGAAVLTGGSVSVAASSSSNPAISSFSLALLSSCSVFSVSKASTCSLTVCCSSSVWASSIACSSSASLASKSASFSSSAFSSLLFLSIFDRSIIAFNAIVLLSFQACPHGLSPFFFSSFLCFFIFLPRIF